MNENPPTIRDIERVIISFVLSFRASGAANDSLKDVLHIFFKCSCSSEISRFNPFLFMILLLCFVIMTKIINFTVSKFIS